MVKSVLQTRYLGMAPDLRHPLAPPEHVYEVRRKRRLVFWERAFVWLMIASMAFMLVNTALFVTIGYEIPYTRVGAMAWFPVMAITGFLARLTAPPSVYQ